LRKGVPLSYRRCLSPVLIAVVASLWPASALAQPAVGHKILGTLGLDAGSQNDTGIYLVARSASYWSSELVDRDGHDLPVGLDLYALGNNVSFQATYLVAPLATYINAGVSVPLAHVNASTQTPQANVDLLGLGDLAVQPLQLGWRLGQVEITTGYTFYAPTAAHEPGGSDGVGKGQWSHEPSLGGTVYFDADRTWAVSVLGSVEINERKLDVDIKRGSTLQLQGGLGKKLGGFLELGVASYALWQLEEDEGRDLPQELRGLHERAYGAGPELKFEFAKIRTNLSFRYEHDLAVWSRTAGQIFVAGVGFAPWMKREKP
jgi:hypothetical protein